MKRKVLRVLLSLVGRLGLRKLVSVIGRKVFDSELRIGSFEKSSYLYVKGWLDPWEACEHLKDFKYRKDPSLYDYVSDPLHTHATKSGDCDDYHSLVANLIDRDDFACYLMSVVFPSEGHTVCLVEDLRSQGPNGEQFWYLIDYTVYGLEPVLPSEGDTLEQAALQALDKMYGSNGFRNQLTEESPYYIYLEDPSLNFISTVKVRNPK